MRPALLVTIALGAAGCGENPCREGTALVGITLGQAVAAYAVEEVEVEVSGPRTASAVRSWPKGATRARIEIEFPAGYPTGAELKVDATARKTGTSIGRAHSATYLGEGCATIEMAIDGLDCGGVHLCVDGSSCATQPCVDACRAAASTEGRQQYDALVACVVSACPSTVGRPCAGGLATSACRSCYASAVAFGGACWIDFDDCLDGD